LLFDLRTLGQSDNSIKADTGVTSDHSTWHDIRDVILFGVCYVIAVASSLALIQSLVESDELSYFSFWSESSLLAAMGVEFSALVIFYSTVMGAVVLLRYVRIPNLDELSSTERYIYGIISKNQDLLWKLGAILLFVPAIVFVLSVIYMVIFEAIDFAAGTYDEISFNRFYGDDLDFRDSIPSQGRLSGIFGGAAMSVGLTALIVPLLRWTSVLCGFLTNRLGGINQRLNDISPINNVSGLTGFIGLLGMSAVFSDSWIVWICGVLMLIFAFIFAAVLLHILFSWEARKSFNDRLRLRLGCLQVTMPI
jgi:hypothetical protein